MKREDLLKNEGYWTSKIQIDLYNEVNRYMKDNKINQSDLAKKLGVSKGYISQILNGDFDHRISKLVALCIAIEKYPEIRFNNLNNFIQNDSEGNTTIYWEVTVPISGMSDLKEQTSRIEKIADVSKEMPINPSNKNKSLSYG